MYSQKTPTRTNTKYDIPLENFTEKNEHIWNYKQKYNMFPNNADSKLLHFEMLL